MPDDDAMPPAMTPERAAALIAAYGGHCARWPKAERAAALRLVLGDPDLRAQYEAARALDGALDAAAEPASPSEALVARVLAARPRRTSWGALGASLAACALFGLVFGFGAGRDLAARAQDAALDAAFETEALDWEGDIG